MDSVEELMEYMWLRTKVTLLNVDVFVDDGGSYVRHEHELLLFIRNGYEKFVNEFIPVSISQNPVILANEMTYNISNDDIITVKNFIIANSSLLQALADRRITHMEFVQSLSVQNSQVWDFKL